MIILKEGLLSQPPEAYYHATFKAYLPGIKKNGLGGGKHKKNWDISVDGKTYFVNDKDIAASYCESADEVPERVYDSGIIILSIDINELNNVEVDENMINEDDDLMYITTTDVIPFNKLTVEEYE